MNSRARVALLVLCMCAGVTFLATSAHAQSNLHDATGSFSGLLDLIKNNANAWAGRLRGYATHLFWILATIQLVWTFFPLVLRQADFGEIVGELVRFILVIGFFFALLTYSVDWATAVVDSFRTAGGAASGLGQELKPGDIFGLAIDMAKTIGDVETWNPLAAMSIAVAGLVVLLCFAFIAAFMAVTLVESYIVINASVLFMGFGGGQWTREYAIAMARYAVAVGAKLFVLTLIVGLILQSAHQWQAAYNHDDASMWTMVGLALVCAYLAKQIPDLVQSLITGTSMGGGHALGGMAMAAAAVATAGAAAAAGAASAGAGAAAGGAGGAAGGGAAGGAAGSGGLAGAINASMSGAPNMARSATAGLDGVASPASTLAPRMGGSPGSSSGRSSGMNGSGASSSTGSGTSAARTAANAGQGQGQDQKGAQAGQQAASAASGEAGEGATPAGSASASTAPENGSPASAPSGAGGEPGQTPSPAATESTNSTESPASAGGGLTGHHMAAGVVRTLGALSAMSVPGMEGAAGLSLGPRPPSGDQPGEREPGAEFRSTPENTIAPAVPPVAPPASAPPSATPGTPPVPPSDEGTRP